MVKKRQWEALLLAGLLAVNCMACGKGAKEEKTENEHARSEDAVELSVFVAASLHTVMQQLAEIYGQEHPEVKILFNADSSGKLMTQIEEGYSCDVFFSASAKQMDQLEEDGLLIEGSRVDLLGNQVIVIKRADTVSKVTGLRDIGNAASFALADGSVPVGRYTRQALMELGILVPSEDAAAYTTVDVSSALGGIEISEQGNVSQVLYAVREGSCEVGTVYYSDLYGYEEELEVLETVSKELTGEVIYPVGLVKNLESNEAEMQAARDFVSFLTSDTAKAVFESFYFDTRLR